jgi:hypothetical protein
MLRCAIIDNSISFLMQQLNPRTGGEGPGREEGCAHSEAEAEGDCEAILAGGGGGR